MDIINRISPLINRISPFSSSKSRSTSRSSSRSPNNKSKTKRRKTKPLTVKPKKTVKNNQEWNEHLKACAKKYGITTKQAASHGECREAYYANKRK
uniref:Uncharacterized protein n=1 Tax=viral metagenome TaxID=1070528 RepID=A0A6C0LQG8_9ZZZZ